MQILVTQTLQHVLLQTTNTNSVRHCLYYSLPKPTALRSKIALDETVPPASQFCQEASYSVFREAKHSNVSVAATVTVNIAHGSFSMFQSVPRDLVVADSLLLINLENAADARVCTFPGAPKELLNVTICYLASQPGVAVFLGVASAVQQLTIENLNLTAQIDSKRKFCGICEVASQLQIRGSFVYLTSSGAEHFSGICESATFQLNIVNTAVYENVSGDQVNGVVQILEKSEMNVKLCQFTLMLTAEEDVSGFAHQTILNDTSANNLIIEETSIFAALKSDEIPSLIAKTVATPLTLKSITVTKGTVIWSRTAGFGVLLYQSSSTVTITEVSVDLTVETSSLNPKIGYVMFESLAGGSQTFYSSTSNIVPKQFLVRGLFSDCPCTAGDCQTNTNLSQICVQQLWTVSGSSNHIVHDDEWVEVLINDTKSLKIFCNPLQKGQTVNNLNNSIINLNLNTGCTHCSVGPFCNYNTTFYRMTLKGGFQINAAGDISLISGLIGATTQNTNIIMCIISAVINGNYNSNFAGLIGYAKSGVVNVKSCIVNGSLDALSYGEKKVAGGIIAFIESGSVLIDNCTVNVSKFISQDTFGGFVGIVRAVATLTIQNCVMSGNISSIITIKPLLFATAAGVIGIIEDGAIVMTSNIQSEPMGPFQFCDCAKYTGSPCSGITCNKVKIELTSASFVNTINLSANCNTITDSKYAIGNDNVNNSKIVIKGNFAIGSFGTLKPQELFINIVIENDGRVEFNAGWEFAGVLTIMGLGAQNYIINCEQNGNFEGTGDQMVSFVTISIRTTRIFNCSVTGTINSVESGYLLHQVDISATLFMHNMTVSGNTQNRHFGGYFVRINTGSTTELFNMTITGDISGTSYITDLAVVPRLQGNAKISFVNFTMKNNKILGYHTTAALVAHTYENSIINLTNVSVSTYISSAGFITGALFGWLDARTTVLIDNVTFTVQPGSVYGSCPVSLFSPLYNIVGVTCINAPQTEHILTDCSVSSGRMNVLAYDANKNYNQSKVNFNCPDTVEVAGQYGEFDNKYILYQDIYVTGIRQTQSGKSSFGAIVQQPNGDCMMNNVYIDKQIKSYAWDVYVVGGFLIERNAPYQLVVSNATVKVRYYFNFTSTLGFGGVSADIEGKQTIMNFTFDPTKLDGSVPQKIYAIMMYKSGGSCTAWDFNLPAGVSLQQSSNNANSCQNAAPANPY